jgi:DNA polymerase-3 subunit delta'
MTSDAAGQAPPVDQRVQTSGNREAGSGNWDVLGHERALEILRAGLETDALPQSLLLTGPPQVGKRTVALALARAVTCTGSHSPCGSCRACRLAASGGYPDVHLIQLREGRQRIGIGDVQALQVELARRPAEGKRRVAVIVDADRFSPEAENCLLKTLEEPPPYGLILLTAQEAEALLPTTVSRCRRIRLRPVPASTIAGHLVKRFGVDAERARRLAGLAEGRPGWAIAAATDPGRLEAYETALEHLLRAAGSGKLERLAISRVLAEGWSGKSEQVREELRVWTRWWRDLLMIKLGLPEHVAHVDRRDELLRQAERCSEAELREAIGLLVQARTDLDQNVNPRLALDVALLRLPVLSDG